MFFSTVNQSDALKHVKFKTSLLKHQECLKFDPQHILERRSLSETWNYLMRNGSITDVMVSSCGGISNNNLSSPIGTFPCACCEGLESESKCQFLSSPSQSSDVIHLESINKALSSWTWDSQDMSRSMNSFISWFPFILIIYMYFN